MKLMFAHLDNSVFSAWAVSPFNHENSFITFILCFQQHLYPPIIQAPTICFNI